MRAYGERARSSREGKPSAAGLSHAGGLARGSTAHVAFALVPGIATQPRPWRRFAALGDSFTEGLADVRHPGGRYQGWADRAAAVLADRQPDGFEYANLAIRGRLVAQVADEQVPVAVRLRPDLVSLAAGVNDALRSSFDLDATATAIEGSVRELRGAGADVLLFAFGDPSRRSRIMGAVGARIAALNSATAAIAQTHGCYLVSFWGLAAFDDDRFWDEDRLHLSPAGHARAAAAALEALGVGDDRWRTPVHSRRPGLPVRAWGHARWAGVHLAPWLVRRARGISSGDGVLPKQPDWAPAPQIADPLA